MIQRRAASPGLSTAVHLTPLWRRHAALRRVRVDDHGVWHVQIRGGAWLSTRPDRFDLGPAGLWLRLSGPVLSRSSRARTAPGRLGATLWAWQADRHSWRRLHVAAQWHMQRAGVQQQAAGVSLGLGRGAK